MVLGKPSLCAVSREQNRSAVDPGVLGMALTLILVSWIGDLWSPQQHGLEKQLDLVVVLALPIVSSLHVLDSLRLRLGVPRRLRRTHRPNSRSPSQIPASTGV